MRKARGLIAVALLALSFMASGYEVAHRATPQVLPQATPAISLTRYPYLQSVTSTSILIAWRTDVPTNSRVRYDSNSPGDCARYQFLVSDDSQTKDHALTLTELAPDTTYYYCVEGNRAVLARGESFSTARTPDNPRVRFAVLSDSHGGARMIKTLAGIMKEEEVDLVLHVGDMVERQGGVEYRDSGFFRPFEDLLRAVPIFTTIGNHDSYGDNGQSYLDDFYLPHNNPEGSELYYSFNYGNAHFVSLAVIEPEFLDWKEGSPQYHWLVDDLVNTGQFWKIVFFHFVPYTASQKYHNKYLDVRETLGPILEKYGADLVFNGHSHDYERSVPLKEYHPDSKGVVYVVAGGGGATPLPVGEDYWTAYAEAVNHTVIVDVDGPVLKLRAIRADGSLMDSLTIDRSSEPSAPRQATPATLGEGAEDGGNSNLLLLGIVSGTVVLILAVVFVLRRYRVAQKSRR